MAMTAASLEGLYAECEALVSESLGCLDAADEAVAKAQAARPELADVLHHARPLLVPTHPRMSTRFVYESHARELLARVTGGEPWKRGAAGADTRPATDAELVCALSDVSKAVPLHGAGYGLMGRLWTRAFPGQPNPHEGLIGDYERVHGSEIDDLERAVRRIGAQPWRLIDPAQIDCQSRHDDEPVACRYARQPTLFDEEEASS